MRMPARRFATAALCAALLAFSAAPAADAAAPEPDFILSAGLSVPPGSGFAGACGVAVAPGSNNLLYVSDYYHHAVDVFTSGGGYVTQLPNVDPLDGPCDLAVAPDGRLHVNSYHRSLLRYTPSAYPPTVTTSYGAATTIDTAHPTGVAIDAVSGNVYVDNRTYVSVYDSSGAPVLNGGEPLRIGAGSLVDGNGLAISGFAGTLGRLYVPDAGSNTIKVYDPAVDVATPVATIAGPSGGFTSLRDSAIDVDRVTGQVYVVDNLQPGVADHPQAIVHVFNPTGAYAGHLKYNVVHGEPSGLAVDNSTLLTQGRVYVTSGNGAGSVVYAYPAHSATNTVPICAPGGSSCPGPGGAGATFSFGPPQGIAAVPTRGQISGTPQPASSSVIAQKGKLRVSIGGKLAPRRLPRTGVAPISVSIDSRISTTDASQPPQLDSLRIELNRHGQLDHSGLPTCPYNRIQPGSSARALAGCRSSLVGRGSFTADITLAGQEPYPTSGRLLVFSSRRAGKPVLYGHIYSPRPFATSFVIVFAVRHLSSGVYGTALDAPMPAAMDAWGRLTGLQMTLSRRYRHHGERRSYLSSGCPAPEGFTSAVFPLARTSFVFTDGPRLQSVLTSVCRVRKGS